MRSDRRHLPKPDDGPTSYPWKGRSRSTRRRGAAQTKALAEGQHDDEQDPNRNISPERIRPDAMSPAPSRNRGRHRFGSARRVASAKRGLATLPVAGPGLPPPRAGDTIAPRFGPVPSLGDSALPPGICEENRHEPPDNLCDRSLSCPRAARLRRVGPVLAAAPALIQEVAIPRTSRLEQRSSTP